MKQQFIENLKNGKIPAAQNRKELAALTAQGESFSPLAEHIKQGLKFTSQSYWVNDYFFNKVNLLINNFSQELCEHLIAVKERLQQIPTQGFAVEEMPETIKSAVNFSQDLSKAKQYAEPDLSRYIPNSKLTDYLQSNDVSAIRAFLSAELSDFRLTIEELIQAVFFVAKNAKGVFEEYKTSAFIAAIETDEGQWNSRYFDKQQGDLNQNFALERFFHLVNVRETLMKKGDPDFQQIQVERKEPKLQTKGVEPKRNTSQSEQHSHRAQQPTQTTGEPVENQPNFKVLAAILAVGGLVALALWKLIH